MLMNLDGVRFGMDEPARTECYHGLSEDRHEINVCAVSRRVSEGTENSSW